MGQRVMGNRNLNWVRPLFFDQLSGFVRLSFISYSSFLTGSVLTNFRANLSPLVVVTIQRNSMGDICHLVHRRFRVVIVVDKGAVLFNGSLYLFFKSKNCHSRFHVIHLGVKDRLHYSDPYSGCYPSSFRPVRSPFFQSSQLSFALSSRSPG